MMGAVEEVFKFIIIHLKIRMQRENKVVTCKEMNQKSEINIQNTNKLKPEHKHCRIVEVLAFKFGVNWLKMLKTHFTLKFP